MGFKSLADAIAVHVLYLHYNMFRGRATRPEFRDMLNAHHEMPHRMARGVWEFLQRRCVNNPWIYYGPWR